MVVVYGRILSPFGCLDIVGRRQPRCQCTARWRGELDASIGCFLCERLLPPILVFLPVGNVEKTRDNINTARRTPVLCTTIAIAKNPRCCRPSLKITDIFTNNHRYICNQLPVKRILQSVIGSQYLVAYVYNILAVHSNCAQQSLINN